MTKYTCKKCVFSTINKTDYNRHIKTTKHLLKAYECKNSTNISPNRVIKKSYKSPNKKFVCTCCNNGYANQCNLTRHMKKCANSVLVEKDKELQNIKNENILDKVKMLEKEIERLQKELDLKDKQIDTFAELLKSSMSQATGNNLTKHC
jgi:DNA gyrase/topoisomerase IV subunit A